MQVWRVRGIATTSPLAQPGVIIIGIIIAVVAAILVAKVATLLFRRSGGGFWD